MKALKLFPIILLLNHCVGPRPQNLGRQQTNSTGMSKTTLKPCGEKPNCVTSYIHNEDRDHYYPAIKINTLTSKAKKKILDHFKENDNIKIITQSDSYIYAEFTSSLFGFVDDVELYFSQEGVIHFRSASRVGYSDLGANKKRIQKISQIANGRF